MTQPYDYSYRISIAEVRPQLDCGDTAVKRVVGDRLRVSADIIKDGHDVLRAWIRYHHRGMDTNNVPAWGTIEMQYNFDEDEWTGEVPLTEVGEWEYTVEAWTDEFESWKLELSRKVTAGNDVSSELLEGIHILRDTANRLGKSESNVSATLRDMAKRTDDAPDQQAKVRVMMDQSLAELMRLCDPRADMTRYARSLPVVVDRERARFGAWYEMFPRSQGRIPGKHSTFAEAAQRLPAIRSMGFDVVYLPPIHPIGRTNRKGKNNSLVAGPGDPGSPYAIGGVEGGHDSIHPELGTLEDFDNFVQAASAVDMEVALDFAIQCSPNHPYVREHPEWFKHRPDGTIKYAENPPKRYEDIVAIDMWCENYPELWNELKRVLVHWINHGVHIFRVDNPHTKPIAFWEWLIGEVKRDYPDVIFLSEAFTRPKRMQKLAKVGFTQSYTYFTWRNTRYELEEYLTEWTTSSQADYMRPNFFPNTPDILHEYLQHGGRPAFKIRFCLASTLSPSYGIYSGYELIENTPLREGSEEYLNSEKYEIRVRDWTASGNINSYIQRINHTRIENRALQLFTNLQFHYADNPNIISYSKISEDGSNRILVVANLDPYSMHEATLHLVNSHRLRIDGGSRYIVHDLITDARYEWYGTANYVKLDPGMEPAHIFRIESL